MLYFSFLIFFNFNWLFLIFSISLLRFSLSSSIFLLSLISIFRTTLLNFVSSKLLISVLLSSSSRVLTYSSVSSFCLILCFYFYVLGRSVMFLSLGEVALCRCPVGHILLWSPVLYALGLPLVWASWALLLW